MTQVSTAGIVRTLVPSFDDMLVDRVTEKSTLMPVDSEFAPLFGHSTARF